MARSSGASRACRSEFAALHAGVGARGATALSEGANLADVERGAAGGAAFSREGRTWGAGREMGGGWRATGGAGRATGAEARPITADAASLLSAAAACDFFCCGGGGAGESGTGEMGHHPPWTELALRCGGMSGTCAAAASIAAERAASIDSV